MDQLDMVTLGSLFPFTHPYRRFQEYVPDASNNHLIEWSTHYIFNQSLDGKM